MFLFYFHIYIYSYIFLYSGIVCREDLWITSKLWNDFHATEDVEKACIKSCSLLKLDYLDLYLIHWPCTPIEAPVLTPATQETWCAMEKLVEKGLTKTIGVSNFTISKLEAMKEYSTITPAVNQVEAHPMWHQNELFNYCKENRYGSCGILIFLVL